VVRQKLQNGDKYVNAITDERCASDFMVEGCAARLRRISPRRAERYARRADASRRGGAVWRCEAVKGVDGGVFEIAIRHRGDAFRAIYAVKIDVDIWVIHAFQKKSKSGVKTPQVEVDLIRERLKRLKEALK
jgi:phage-related protein